MADAIFEQILDKMKAKYLLINGTGSFATDVESVVREEQNRDIIVAVPGILIVDLGDRERRDVRQLREFVQAVQVAALIEHDDVAERNNLLADLIKDIKFQTYANLTWDGLAVHTRIIGRGPELSEVVAPTASDSIVMEVLFRTQELDSSVVENY